MNNQDFSQFSSANECKHLSWLSILSFISLFAVIRGVVSSFVHSHSCLSPLEIPTYSQNSSHKYPMPLDFQFKEPQLLTEFQKAACGIGVDIFWNHQTHQHKSIKNETDNCIIS